MRRVLIVLLAGATLGETVMAQDAAYEAKALRIEDSRGDTYVVRGTPGTVVGKIGVFRGTDIVQLVGSSERAKSEAQSFVRNYKPGTLSLAAGIAVLGVGIGSSRIREGSQILSTGLLLSGTALVVYGAGRLEKAYNALARSIWWYNHDLLD
ncbi:MAG TPA: hypothetical protein VGG76_07335 [Gemmatimonadaceae bacterium]|jgi:hypothetical protein